MDAGEPSADSDLFALPQSARSERRKRQLEKKSEMAKTPKESRLTSNQGTTVSTNNVQKTDLQEGQQNLIIGNEESFLSKVSVAVYCH